MTARKSVYAIPLTHGCRIDIDRLTRCGMDEVDQNMEHQNDTNDESITEAEEYEVLQTFGVENDVRRTVPRAWSEPVPRDPARTGA
jgi:hypothetical protein